MSELILEPNAVASWHRVVSEAAVRVRYPLDEDRESYLVFMLQRYLARPEMVRSVLAMQFLEGLGDRGRVRSEHLRDVGDQCLLFAGLFPGQAERRRVNPDYFIDLGRSAYTVVAEGSAAALAALYHSLAEAFAALADVLFALRGDPSTPLLGALDAAEQAVGRSGPLGHAELARYTDATPVAGNTVRH